MVEYELKLGDFCDFEGLFGSGYCNLTFVQNELNVMLDYIKQSGVLKIRGSGLVVFKARRVFETLLNFLKFEKIAPSFAVIEQVVGFFNGRGFNNNFFDGRVCLNSKKEVVLVKNFNQMFYCDSIKRNAITFGVGPAGTGKTYLAVAMAALALKNRTHSRIVFTRPVIEAGENLGFLPGDLQRKVDPFLKPLYDAMSDFVGVEGFGRLVERGIVEVLPLAYMRGRSLNDSFIVLDEAQNTTSGQMKMFLTRLGFNSKMVINGDLTQVDLPFRVESGLLQATKILNNVEDIAVVRFEDDDVVRSSLVQQILRAYEGVN